MKKRICRLLPCAGWAALTLGLLPIATTKTAAETIGDGANCETLEAGKRADFLVLSANPSEDIKNAEKLAAGWHGGVSVPLSKTPDE